MSGHSKWAGIKHKKAVVDAKRGKAFTKVSKELTVAAKIGGGNPDMNPRLRLAVDKARAVNMPADTIKRAIMKGTGELPGVAYEEIAYEGYGPGGVALLIEVMTDNRNRTVGEIRHLLSKHNGNMGETGCVSWMFTQKGYILVNKITIDEDTLMSAALDAGADDFKNDPAEENYEIITAPEDLNR
ncbi:MAG: YebC/PmpR family DNA-binding transcriptional regulator, partial [Nitrospiraceae bacterium]